MHTALIWNELVTLAQAPAAAPNGLNAGSLWDLVLKGGWIMLPIGLCSLVALTIIVERLVLLRRGRVAPAALIDGMQWSDPEKALQRCEADGSPLAEVLAVTIRARNEPRETRDRLIEEEGQRQVLRLRQRMRLLGALPQVATMLGLLGTVMGMIRTFTVVAASGEALGKTERLAQGIYEAWTATAAGLAVAIPVLVLYHAIMGRIDGAAALLDRSVLDWLNRDTRTKPAAEPVAAAPAPARVESTPAEANNGVVTVSA